MSLDCMLRPVLSKALMNQALTADGVADALAAPDLPEGADTQGGRRGGWKRRKGARPAEILQAARACFAAHGFERTSVAQIALQAGVVEGTIYTYFANKRALLEAVLGSFHKHLIAELTPLLQQPMSTRDALQTMAMRHLVYVDQDPELARLLVREMRAHAHDYFGSGLHALNRGYTRLLIEILRSGQARGDVRADIDLALVRDLFFGGIEHACWRVLRLDAAARACAVEQVGRDIGDLIWRAVSVDT